MNSSNIRLWFLIQWELIKTGGSPTLMSNKYGVCNPTKFCTFSVNGCTLHIRWFQPTDDWSRRFKNCDKLSKCSLSKNLLGSIFISLWYWALSNGLCSLGHTPLGYIITVNKTFLYVENTYYLCYLLLNIFFFLCLFTIYTEPLKRKKRISYIQFNMR